MPGLCAWSLGRGEGQHTRLDSEAEVPLEGALQANGRARVRCAFEAVSGSSAEDRAERAKSGARRGAGRHL